MKEPREETELFFSVGHWWKARVGDGANEGVVHHFIAGANENIHRLPPFSPSPLCTLAASEWQRDAKRGVKRKKTDERGSHDIWACSRARGSFHTFLQSLFLLSSWKDLIFMSVLERILSRTSHGGAYVQRCEKKKDKEREKERIRKRICVFYKVNKNTTLKKKYSSRCT